MDESITTDVTQSPIHVVSLEPFGGRQSGSTEATNDSMNVASGGS